MSNEQSPTSVGPSSAKDDSETSISTEESKDNDPKEDSSLSGEIFGAINVKRIIGLSVFLRVLLMLLLLYVVIGSFFFPYWWYAFLMKGGIFRAKHWNWGLSWVYDNLVWPVVIIGGLLALAYFLSPESWKTQGKSYFASAASSGIRKKIRVIEILLVVLLVTSLLTLASRSARDPARFAEEDELNRLLADRPTVGPQENWVRELLKPTTFLYLAKESVDSLYGQYEPNMIPSSVIEELKESNQVKAGVKLETFLTTEAGKEELQRKMTEYKQTVKSHERKFKELLQFLLEKQYLKRYASIEESSPQVEELDNAIEIIRRKHSISVDAKQLMAVRDRLLSQRIDGLVKELTNLKGLALVDGRWKVEKQTDAFILRRPFIDNVTDPPVCEIKIRKSELSESNLETIDRSAGDLIQLRVFGNVPTGMGTARVVHLNPVAIF